MDNLPKPPPFVDQLRRSALLVAQKPPELATASPEQLIALLHDSNLREAVLSQLNVVIKQKREMCSNLALLLWNSFNTVYILLQEVLAVYPKLSTSTLTMKESTRVCDALTLLQCMASHPETRKGLVKANIPFYLYPFLRASANEKPLEFVRLSSLGLIGSLAKFDDPYGPEILNFFLETQLFPLCLRCMDQGDELSRKVATLIVMKILMQEEGLDYCCAFTERFLAVVQALSRLVEKLSVNPCFQLLKYVVQCYLCLSQVSRVCDVLRYNFPPQLIDNTFHIILRVSRQLLSSTLEDPDTLNMLHQIFFNITSRGSRP
ncbi:PREDICTED: cell differentiation protein rcd1-like [Nicotiana attenuata]|uniref:cell differentiation protein rcd1-like n=1 Tax=Nicotiana attenuata TaxID=49451 RepID=UPI0009048CED|nr:PREDICTED: cell differentiation protein rcd1-like [Nicotiana attenuata]